MNIIVNKQVSDIYNNYFNGNYYNISVNSKIVKKDNKRYIKKYINLEKIDDIIDNYNSVNISLSELSKMIIKHFIENNIIMHCGISKLEDRLVISLLNEENKSLNVISPNIQNEYPGLLEYVYNLNIITNNYYQMIDNNMIDNISLYFTESECNTEKTIFFRPNLKQVTIVAVAKDFGNMEEISNFINYFISKNKSYLLNSVETIDINEMKPKKIYRFSNQKEIVIKGKEMINYIERGDFNERDNNGKISKPM